MTHILQLDASARPGLAGTDEHGSHSRHLTHQFIKLWLSHRPQDTLTYRDVGLKPPSFINRNWIHAAFTPPEKKEPWMVDVLAESDELIDELIAADIVVIGAPLYNFGMPAALKAWIDQVVRAGRTVKFVADDPQDPYKPCLNDRSRHAIILSARGGSGFGRGGKLEHLNHLEPNLSTALEFIGITRIHRISIEHQEVGGELLAASIAEALCAVETLVDELQMTIAAGEAHQPA